ncbi:uncharacterized protein LOC143634431 [Bidens hawaiensis]|uniref:uncharacterized protein LOC143634431 n=1 Tax=Bidens hawaiensis TaxID=980011 RepID=UPI00404B75A5
MELMTHHLKLGLSENGYFLLVDINGDAVEAVAPAKTTQHPIGSLQVNWCYSIQKRICTLKRYTMQTVYHKASTTVEKCMQRQHTCISPKLDTRAVAYPHQQRSPGRLCETHQSLKSISLTATTADAPAIKQVQHRISIFCNNGLLQVSYKPRSWE